MGVVMERWCPTQQMLGVFLRKENNCEETTSNWYCCNRGFVDGIDRDVNASRCWLVHRSLWSSSGTDTDLHYKLQFGKRSRFF
jgi:hypothetical protein